MLRLASLGIWVIVVTAAATYGAVMLRQESGAPDKKVAEDLGVEELKTEMTSVPVIRGGDVIGYVIIQMSFQADRAELQKLNLEPTPYLMDAAFRAIFSSDNVDFSRMRGSDLSRLTSEIAREANVSLGDSVIRTVLIQQLNFVRKEDIRTNWIKGDRGSNGHE